MQDDVVIDIGAQLDAATRELAGDPLAGTTQVLSLAIDPSSQRLAVGMPGRVAVYSLATASLLDQHVLVDIAAHAPLRLTYTSDGRHLVAVCTQLVNNTDSVSSLLVLAENKKKPVLGVPGAKALERHDWDIAPTSGVVSWALSPDASRLATAWDVQGVAVWNVASRRRERIVIKAPDLESDAGPLDVHALAFTGDGDTIAVLLAGALEVHPCGKGPCIVRIDIDETFGASRLAYTDEGILWARAAPGISETCLIDPHSTSVARRPIALEKVQPLRIDATSVLWRQEVGEGDAREQVLVRHGR